MNNNTAQEVHHKPSNDQSQALSEEKPQPIFQEFTWYTGESECAKEELIQDAHDIANGIAVIAGLLEASEVAVDSGIAPILAPTHRGHLMRMVITSANMLAAECGDQILASNADRRRKNLQAGGCQ